MVIDQAGVNLAIQNALRARKNGDRREARRWAEQAVRLGRDLEEPWLVLAEMASPHARIFFLEQVLRINPHNPTAQEAIKQARLPGNLPTQSTLKPLSVNAWNRSLMGGVKIMPLFIMIFMVVGLLTWQVEPSFAQTIISHAGGVLAKVIGDKHLQNSEPGTVAGVLASQTPAPTPTPTLTLVPSFTITNTQTTTPTDVPTSTATATPLPTRTPDPTAVIPTLPGTKLIVVNIAQQHLYAYEGGQLVFSFVASTGSDNSTFTGNFSILDKDPDAYSDPWGFWMPDWMGIYWVGDAENGFHSLPVLDNGQQIWGNEIGQPITYGCVVLEPGDMKKLYDWASVGTTVQIK